MNIIQHDVESGNISFHQMIKISTSPDDNVEPKTQLQPSMNPYQTSTEQL